MSSMIPINKNNIEHVYYYGLIDNALSIIRKGILPYNDVYQNKIKHKSFANEEVQNRRNSVKVLMSDSNQYLLHDLSPTYFNPKNPTTFASRKFENAAFIIKLSFNKIIQNKVYAFSDGNAACKETKFFNSLGDLKKMPWDVLTALKWNSFVDGTRKRNCELLVYPNIPISYAIEFIVKNNKTLQIIRDHLNKEQVDIPVNINKKYFYEY